MEDVQLHSCMRHEPRSRHFVNKLDAGRVLLKLQSECDDIREGVLLWREGVGRVPTRSAASGDAAHNSVALEHLGHVNGHEYFSAIVPGAQPFEYAFRVHACGTERWV